MSQRYRSRRVIRSQSTKSQWKFFFGNHQISGTGSIDNFQVMPTFSGFAPILSSLEEEDIDPELFLESPPWQLSELFQIAVRTKSEVDCYSSRPSFKICWRCLVLSRVNSAFRNKKDIGYMLPQQILTLSSEHANLASRSASRNASQAFWASCSLPINNGSSVSFLIRDWYVWFSSLSALAKSSLAQAFSSNWPPLSLHLISSPAHNAIGTSAIKAKRTARRIIRIPHSNNYETNLVFSATVYYTAT